MWVGQECRHTIAGVCIVAQDDYGFPWELFKQRLEQAMSAFGCDRIALGQFLLLVAMDNFKIVGVKNFKLPLRGNLSFDLSEAERQNYKS
jgi:hypothetical protein